MTNDPCESCDRLTVRNEFIRQNWQCLFDRLNIHPHLQPRSSGTLNADSELIWAIIESSCDCISVWDRDLVCRYANRASLQQVGAVPAAVIGKDIWNGLSHVPDFVRLWKSRIETVLKTGRPLHVADEGMLMGKQVYSESTLSPVRAPDGTVFAVSIVYRDVTERRMLERKAIEDEQKYRQLYEQAQIPLYRSRLSDGKMLECNHAMAELLGYASKQECLAEHFATEHYANPALRDVFLERLKKEGKVSGFDMELIRKDGVRKWVRCFARLYADRDCIEGVQVDITAQKVLTPAEKAVLAVMMQGKSSKEIAALLGRSVRTIEDHRSHMMHKLGAANLVELIQAAQSLNHTLPSEQIDLLPENGQS